MSGRVPQHRVIAGNNGAHGCLAAHGPPLVRAHAVWAVFRLGGRARLAATRAEETDATVLAEYAAAE
jgi:epoxyqueuosine reductase